MTRRSHAHDGETGRPKPLADQTAGLGLFERVAIQESDEENARDSALEQHASSRSALLDTLRAAALDAWRRERRPVSVNDVRAAIATLDVGDDRRFLGGLFNHRDWVRVGSTQTNCDGATVKRVGQSRGSVGTYEPTAEVQAREQKAPPTRGAAA